MQLLAWSQNKIQVDVFLTLSLVMGLSLTYGIEYEKENQF